MCIGRRAIGASGCKCNHTFGSYIYNTTLNFRLLDNRSSNISLGKNVVIRHQILLGYLVGIESFY